MASRTFLIPAILLCLALPASAHAATAESLAAACLNYWKGIMDKKTQYAVMEPKLKKLCACQADATVKSGVDNAQIDELQRYFSGKRVTPLKMRLANDAFNKSEALCEKRASAD
jgi:hypothetical protein